MMTSKEAARVVRRHGKDILDSERMQLEKGFCQHGDVSVFDHSFSVAVMCVRMASELPFRVNIRALVRGALLHDYFLYDWHVPDESHRLHGFHHAATAYRNARRDFSLGRIEKNMILAHMFPLNMVLPKHRESMILWTADKICAVMETMRGRASLPTHLTQEEQHRKDGGDKCIAKHPPKVRENSVKLTARDGALHLDRMCEGQNVTDFAESAADQFNIEPDAGEPAAEVGQKSTADAADLLDVHDTAGEQSEGHEEDGRGQESENGEQCVNGEVKPQGQGNQIADNALCQ